MRLFVAVLPPASAAEELAQALQDLRDDRLRWTGRAGWHFTLAFLGEVRDEVLPELHTRLERAAHRTAPFPLRLHGAGHFGDRALWVGAAGGIDAMRMLSERAEAAARRAGVPMGRHHRYTPHLTLGRSRDIRRDHPEQGSGDDLRPYLDGLASFEGTAWSVTELSLVRSNLPTSGIPGEQPRYETVAAWPLEGRPEGSG